MEHPPSLVNIMVWRSTKSHVSSRPHERTKNNVRRGAGFLRLASSLFHSPKSKIMAAPEVLTVISPNEPFAQWSASLALSWASAWIVINLRTAARSA